MADISRKWETGPAVWRRFCIQQHPELGYNGNEHSSNNFFRKHGELLEELGVVRRSSTNRRIVDTDRFEPVVFDLLTLGDVPEPAPPPLGMKNTSVEAESG